MNSNFEWQKHQANERLQRSLQDAESHRLAPKENGRHRGSFFLKLALLAGIFFIVWFLTGCSSQAASAMKPELVDAPATTADSQPAAWSRADRVSFQDKREVYLHEPASMGNAGWTLAERIHFQDRQEAYLSPQVVTRWTLAERIQFQDKREAYLGGSQ